MNNLFISLYESEDKDILKNMLDNKLDYYKYNFLKYNYSADILNNNYGKNMSLSFDLEYILDNILSNKKFSIKMFNLKHNLKKEFVNFTNLNVVFDKTFDELEINYRDMLKEYIFDVIKCNEDIQINEIITQNMMYENDIKHIEEYVNTSNINRNKLKILLVLNDISDYDEEKIKQYIANYKFVDILKMPNINKLDLGKIKNSIDEINEEFGSTIEVISKKNIQEYNIYIMYSNVTYDYFTSHYILKKRSKYIDMRAEDLDLYNNNVLQFEKNKSYILTLAERLNIDITRYSKNKVGSVITEK